MSKSKLEIFKIQRPFVGKDFLLYNEDRSIEQFLPKTEELNELVGSAYKIYVKAKLEDNGTLMIEGLADNQDW